MLRFLRSLSLTLVAAGLLAPTAADAATSKTVYPTVSSISPRKVSIGQKLTVKGAHFRAGKGKSSVVFYRSGKPVLFAKADTATTTALVVTVPDKAADLLADRNGGKVATQLRLRVVGARMGKAWTKNSRSPIVSPAKSVTATPATPAVTPVPGTGLVPDAGALAGTKELTCQELAAKAPTADFDGDGIPNATELKYLVDPCNPDTDGDTMGDGWEYYSALQLNGASIPYPGSKPWPNPLDSTDPLDDFDGDGLSSSQEFALWVYSKSGLPLVQYSDGTQNSGAKHPVATLADLYLDINSDGNLTDDERDADNDGLSNMVEWNLGGQHLWWSEAQYKSEKPYKIRSFSDLDATNPDGDGDGVLDGADDQDNDGWSNFVEAELMRWKSGYRVNAFNPCLPDPESPTCSRYGAVPSSDQWPPFDGSQALYDGIPFAARAISLGGGAYNFVYSVSYSSWVTAGSPAGYTDYPFFVAGPWDPAPFFREAWDGAMGPQG
jgi:IPT/TIG domain